MKKITHNQHPCVGSNGYRRTALTRSIWFEHNYRPQHSNAPCLSPENLLIPSTWHLGTPMILAGMAGVPRDNPWSWANGNIRDRLILSRSARRTLTLLRSSATAVGRGPTRRPSCKGYSCQIYFDPPDWSVEAVNQGPEGSDNGCHCSKGEVVPDQVAKRSRILGNMVMALGDVCPTWSASRHQMSDYRNSTSESMGECRA